MKLLAILDAPSNLGLRPPVDGSVPGCYKLGWALREAGLTEGIDFVDAGVLVPPRYEAASTPGDGDRNADGIAAYSVKLADRIENLVADAFVVVLGGDCSVLIGAALALRRRGRHGLVFLDGHSDFRHPEDSPTIDAAAGEDLAIVTGRGDARLVDLEGLSASVSDTDVVVVGIRSDDIHIAELRDLGMSVWPVERLRAAGQQPASAAIVERVTRPHLDGFWVHLDVDVLDEEGMPAVDSPSPGGLQPNELTELLSALVQHPGAIGIDICIFDPDLDPDGRHAETVASILQTTMDAATTARSRNSA